MHKPLFVLLACSVASGGCAANVGPVSVPVADSADRVKVTQCASTATPTPTPTPAPVFRTLAPKDRMQWMVCELYARAETNLAQSSKWYNKTEWRDLPLLAVATTVAGLLLFGKRGPDNKLVDSAQEGIAIAGFGGATLAAFASYLSPENARAVLRKGSRGHFCMATQGEVILASWDRVESQDKLDTATDLQSRLPALKSEIDKELAKAEASRNAKLPEAQAVYDRGIRAFALYNRQRDWLRVAPVHLGESAWHFGMSLIEQADREAVDVNALVRTITEQTNSMANFEQASASVPGEAGTKAGGAPPVSPPPLEAEARAVRDDLVVLMADLPNVEAMVLGFDNCAAAALIGGSPRATMIQTLTLD